MCGTQFNTYVYIYIFTYTYMYMICMYLLVTWVTWGTIFRVYIHMICMYFVSFSSHEAFSRRNVDANVACWKKRFDPWYMWWEIVLLMVQKSQGQPPFGYMKPVVNDGINYQMVQDFFQLYGQEVERGGVFFLKRWSFPKGISESKLISLWSMFFPGSPKIQFDKRENPGNKRYGTYFHEDPESFGGS